MTAPTRLGDDDDDLVVGCPDCDDWGACPAHSVTADWSPKVTAGVLGALVALIAVVCFVAGALPWPA